MSERLLCSRLAGFTIIEVLVALLVLSVGLLGMASLMARSQKANESAYARSQATLMAYDFIERMRANIIDPDDPSNKNKILFVTDTSNNPATANTGAYALRSLPDCREPSGFIPSDGARRASYDVSSWCATLKETLPSVDADNTQVSFDTSKLASLGIATVRVRVQWQDSDSNDANKTSYVEVETTL